MNQFDQSIGHETVKGIMLGFLFATEVFSSRYDLPTSALLHVGEIQLKKILPQKVAELFVGEDEKTLKSLCNWIDKNYQIVFNESDVDNIQYALRKLELNIAKSRLN